MLEDIWEPFLITKDKFAAFLTAAKPIIISKDNKRYPGIIIKQNLMVATDGHRGVFLNEPLGTKESVIIDKPIFKYYNQLIKHKTGIWDFMLGKQSHVLAINDHKPSGPKFSFGGDDRELPDLTSLVEKLPEKSSEKTNFLELDQTPVDWVEKISKKYNEGRTASHKASFMVIFTNHGLYMSDFNFEWRAGHTAEEDNPEIDFLPYNLQLQKPIAINSKYLIDLFAGLKPKKTEPLRLIIPSRMPDGIYLENEFIHYLMMQMVLKEEQLQLIDKYNYEHGITTLTQPVEQSKPKAIPTPTYTAPGQKYSLGVPRAVPAREKADVWEPREIPSQKTESENIVELLARDYELRGKKVLLPDDLFYPGLVYDTIGAGHFVGELLDIYLRKNGIDREYVYLTKLAPGIESKKIVDFPTQPEPRKEKAKPGKVKKPRKPRVVKPKLLKAQEVIPHVVAETKKPLRKPSSPAPSGEVKKKQEQLFGKKLTFTNKAGKVIATAGKNRMQTIEASPELMDLAETWNGADKKNVVASRLKIPKSVIPVGRLAEIWYLALKPVDIDPENGGKVDFYVHEFRDEEYYPLICTDKDKNTLYMINNLQLEDGWVEDSYDIKTADKVRGKIRFNEHPEGFVRIGLLGRLAWWNAGNRKEWVEWDRKTQNKLPGIYIDQDKNILYCFDHLKYQRGRILNHR